jgi:hypothetical protein
MVAIITRSKSRKFKPHYNRTTGRYYGTSKEYTDDLKAKGLEPYQGEIKRAPKAPYKPSKWAHDMVEAGKNGKVGDVWKEEIAKHGKFKAPDPRLPAAYGGQGGIHED